MISDVTNLIKSLVDFKRIWPKPIGLLFAIIVAIGLEKFILFDPIGFSKTSYLICLIITSISISILWFINRKPPKTKKNKIGFVVSIRCSNEDEGNRIHEDFIMTLQNLIKNGPLGNIFHFIEIKQHIAEKIINREKAEELQKITRSHFVIFGRVRFRQKKYILELEGIVSHGPIKTIIQAKFTNEFNELFPKQIEISEENELLKFEIASQETEHVAKYIMGIAAFLTYDLVTSEILFTDIKLKLSSVDTNSSALKKIIERLPFRFFDIYLTKADFYINRWRESKDPSYISALLDNLDKIDKKIEDDCRYSKKKTAAQYKFLLLKSVAVFLSERDILKAISYIKSCESITNHETWHFNLAFLEAYRGDLKKAIRQYRKCQEFVKIDPQTVNQVEDFICWVLEEEPERYQFHFCLGFINRYIKEDKILALKDFEKFSALVENRQFVEQQELTKQWICELKNEIKNEKLLNEM